MEKFIEIPHLPTDKVTLAIVDYRTPKLVKSILEQRFGIKLLVTPKCYSLYPAVEGHCDMMLYHCGGRDIICAPEVYNFFCEILIPQGFNVIMGKSSLSSNYPKDVAYNIARVSNVAFHNFKCCEGLIKNDLDRKKISKINVKQGYSKCSVAILNEEAIITSDTIIHKKAMENNIDSLLVSTGHIKLWNMDYGFIGGCSGLISSQQLFFCGNIKNHPDFIRIHNFTQKHNIYIEMVEDVDLWDIGTIIPLKQISRV